MTRIEPTYPPLPYRITLKQWVIGLPIVLVSFAITYWVSFGGLDLTLPANRGKGPVSVAISPTQVVVLGTNTRDSRVGCNPPIPPTLDDGRPVKVLSRPCFNSYELATTGDIHFAPTGPEHYQLWRSFNTTPRNMYFIPRPTQGCIQFNMKGTREIQVDLSWLKVELVDNHWLLTPVRPIPNPVSFYWVPSDCP